MDTDAKPTQMHLEYAPGETDKAGQKHDAASLRSATEEELRMAHEALDTKQSPFARPMFRLYYVLLITYFNSGLNGFDGSLWGSLDVFPAVKRVYGYTSTSDTGSAVMACYSIGQIICLLSLVAPLLNDNLGRIKCIFVGCIGIIIATVIQASASTLAQLIIGRLLLGYTATIVNNGAGTYVSEIAHPRWRGTHTGLYNTMYYIGSICATWICVGTESIPSSWSFRIPIILQAVMPIVVCINVLFLPESPRWLMTMGRHEEARAVLAKYHGEGNPNHPIVVLEMEEMAHSIKAADDGRPWWDYRGLFASRQSRRRLGRAAAMGWIGQTLTPGLYYLSVMFLQLNFSTHTSLVLTAVKPMLSWIAAVIGARFSDVFGRRRQMITAAFVLSSLYFLLMGTNKLAVAPNHPSHAAAYASVVLLFLTMITISLGFSAYIGLYPPECLRTEDRAKGMAFMSLMSACGSTLVSYVSGTAFGRIRYYYYLAFGAWTAIVGTFIYFYFVETKGRTLEEMDEIFEADHPVKKSLEKRTTMTVLRTIGA